MERVYLLLGPEQGEKALFISNFIEKVKKDSAVEPEIYRYYPFESKMIDIIALLRNGSLFSEYNIVILNNVEEIKQQSEITILVDYCKDPVSGTTLFLLSDTVKNVNAKIEKAAPKNCKIIFWELYENKKLDWIRAFFRQRDISIDSEAITLLLEMIENNTRDLKQECSRLAQFFGAGSGLKTETIEKYIYHSKRENVFTLFDRIAARDFTASQEILNTILLSKEVEPVGILAGLLWQVRKVHNLKSLLDENYTREEAFSKLFIKNRKSRNIYFEAAGKYSIREIEALIVLIAEFDVRIRSFNTELHGTLLKLFIYYAVIRGGSISKID